MSNNINQIIAQSSAKIKSISNFVLKDVWHDTRETWQIRSVKTLSLALRSFMSADLQSQACALTYRTLLAIVPALALIIAIGRGFGLQNILTEQLYKLFPSQHEMVQQTLGFVDSYLSQSSEGVFVGVGIVFLLWTLISLLGNVESAFNAIWKVSKGRSLWRKATDYLAILLILPILMICIAGISVTMSTALKALLPFEFLTGTITFIIDGIGVVLTWFFFAGAYMLIPNAKVKFLNAMVSGIIVGTMFQALQWVFMSGVMYVSKYNAIYGSFSFLPLFLIWLQLVWLFTLLGALICFAAQNNGQFNFADDIADISPAYQRATVIAIMAIISKRFAESLPPLSAPQISAEYKLPVALCVEITRKLNRLGLVNYVESETSQQSDPAIQPAVDISNLTVGNLLERIQHSGNSGFIPGFNENFPEVHHIAGEITSTLISSGNSTLIKDILK